MSQSPSANYQERFLSLIRKDILKLDLAELDFGIYRILNYRRDQVLEYLESKLPARITAWTDALAQASGNALAETEAANCYYHLHTFFGRYWDDGDFIPRARRGGSAAYAVPYNGQDTHFHWATKGSHYVKSGELFARFAYRDGPREVRFVIAQAEIDKDNAKGNARYFFPVSLAAEDGDYVLTWQWRAPTEAENRRYKTRGGTNTTAQSGEGATADAPAADGATMQDRLLNAWLGGVDFKSAKPAKALDPVKLAENARRFVRKNTSDFFVHPHLGDFLRGELDVYLKHEFVQMWDAADTELPRIRAKFKLVRDIALDLIAFLDQIERFQATLFEKRKFVLQADYLVQCSWLQREGGAEGQKLVAEASAHAGQAGEWAKWVGDASKKPSGKKLLTAYPHLPLHTRHFDGDFKARVLACFEDLEAALGGELVHADNYAALRTLEPAYRERVKCIYIDPPYNTDAGPIDYKNGLRNSSWMSMINSRLKYSQALLRNDGITAVTIDDYQVHELGLLLNDQFQREMQLGTAVIRNNPSGRSTVRGFSLCHEYAFFFAKSESTGFERFPRTDKQLERFSVEEGAHVDWRNFRKDGGAVTHRSVRPKQYYALYVNPKSLTVRVPEMEWQRETREWKELEKPKQGEVRVFPVDEKGRERVWSFNNASATENIDDLQVRIGGDGKPSVFRRHVPSDGVLPRSWWDKPTYAAREYGSATLTQMFGETGTFTFAKAPAAVQDCIWISGLSSDSEEIALDFFAGSATTGHAVISLNRSDNGARKFILVEQGDYFDTVTLPRIAKVMTSPEWKDGKPRDTVQHDDAGDPEHWSRRTLPLVRVLRLERYEDSLNALEFVAPPHDDSGQGAIDLVAYDAQEHLLRYWLMDDSAGHAVRLSTDKLDSPFDYKLTLHEPAGAREAAVDMQETARLLLGLVPRRQRECRDPHGQRHQLMEAVMANDLARGVPQPGPVLLWLRTVDDARSHTLAKAEHDWLAAQVQGMFGRPLSGYARIYHNRAAFWPAGERGESIDSLLAERMMERAH